MFVFFSMVVRKRSLIEDAKEMLRHPVRIGPGCSVGNNGAIAGGYHPAAQETPHQLGAKRGAPGAAVTE